MPATDAIRRLLAYYRSEMFQEAFRKRDAEGGARAAAYRQHLVDQMNEHYKKEAIELTLQELARQALFLEGTVDIKGLATLAADYGVAGLPNLQD